MGTETYLLTPKSSMPAAIPANSATLVAALLVSSASIAHMVGRMPNLSRMSAEKPLPVTAPMRAAISCTTTSENVITKIIHSVA